MLGIEYWILQLSDSLEVRKYYPAEFMEQKPVKINNKTLCIFGSKSGTTKETVKAAEKSQFQKTRLQTRVKIANQ